MAPQQLVERGAVAVLGSFHELRVVERGGDWSERNERPGAAVGPRVDGRVAGPAAPRRARGRRQPTGVISPRLPRYGLAPVQPVSRPSSLSSTRTWRTGVAGTADTTVAGSVP